MRRSREIRVIRFTIGTQMTRIWADLHGFFFEFAWGFLRNDKKIRANPLKSASSVFQSYRSFPKWKLL
jgi:hypothetical protein